MKNQKNSNLMRRMAVLAALLAGFALTGCAVTKGNAAADGPKIHGPRFSIELSPGKTYKTTTGWFIFKYPVYPQVAVWVETVDGTYMGTIYVTGKAEKKNWIAAPSAGRPEALPVWNHLEKDKLDAVSAATSEGATLRDSNLASRLPAGTYAIMLETNRSYDYNSTYTKATSGVCGQPSLVYRALLGVGQGPGKAFFEPIGTGSVDGSDGAIRKGLSGIDSALSLFSKMAIEYGE